MLSGVDLLARAQTGTGKTAAFGLPIIQRLWSTAAASRRKPRALVLVPTRELALQVHQSLAGYAGPVAASRRRHLWRRRHGSTVEALRRGVDVIVATPGRLIDHVQRRSADLSAIEMLILDEADRMLDMGFLPPLKRIAAALPRERQTLLFSATLPDEVINLSKRVHAQRRSR